MTLQRKAWMPRGKGFKPRDPQGALSRGGLRRTPAKPRARKDTGAPQAVRDQVWARERGRCARCGKGLVKGQGGYSIHHLTLRSHGVDNSVEAQILVCGSGSTGCHGWIHAHPAAARAAGWMRLGNAKAGPATEPVMIAGPSGYGWYLLTPEGERVGTHAPDGVAA